MLLPIVAGGVVQVFGGVPSWPTHLTLQGVLHPSPCTVSCPPPPPRCPTPLPLEGVLHPSPPPTRTRKHVSPLSHHFDKSLKTSFSNINKGLQQKFFFAKVNKKLCLLLYNLKKTEKYFSEKKGTKKLKEYDRKRYIFKNSCVYWQFSEQEKGAPNNQ